MQFVPQNKEDLPPYVEFVREAVPRKDLEGRQVFVDLDFAHITRPGGKDTHVEEVANWLAKLRFQTEGGRIPSSWLPHFTQAYERWKSGQELPVEGSPLKTWPLLTPAELKSLLQLGFRTVEDLSTINAEQQKAIGMGAIALQVRAQKWLTENSSQAAALVRENETLRRDLDDLKGRFDELLKAQKVAMKQPATI